MEISFIDLPTRTLSVAGFHSAGKHCHSDKGTGLSLAVLLSNGVDKMPYEIVA